MNTTHPGPKDRHRGRRESPWPADSRLLGDCRTRRCSNGVVTPSSQTLILSWLGRRRVLAGWVRKPSTSTRNRFVVAYRGLAGAVARSCGASLLLTSCAAVNVNPRASRQPCRSGIAAAQGGNG
jgi:hypothetical protein